MLLGLMLPCIPAKGDDAPTGRIRITGEVGYVFLTDSEADLLDDAAAFGGSVGYRFLPYLEARLPLLYSKHDGKDLPEGSDVSLSLLSLTPGLAFCTTGKLSFWFFVGGGVTFVDSKMEYSNLSVSESDVAGATRTDAGLDLNLFRSLSVGAGASLFTSTREVTQYDGSEDWETSVYYAVLGRLTYSFGGPKKAPPPRQP